MPSSTTAAGAGPASGRRANGWQQLRAFAELGVVVADVLSLQSHIHDVLQDHGFSAKQQPASKLPRHYSTTELFDDSDAESELDGRDEDHEYLPLASRADRRALARLTAVIGLRPPSGKPSPRDDDFVDTGLIIDASKTHPATSAEDAERPPRKRKKARGRRGRGRRKDRDDSPSSAGTTSSRTRSPCDSPTASSRAGEDIVPEPVTVTLALPLAGEGSKRRRRGKGSRRQPRALLEPEQKAVVRRNDKARLKRSRTSRLHAILLAADVTQRRMRSQTEQAARDRRIAAPRMLAFLKATAVVGTDVPIQRMMHGSSLFTNTYHVRPEEQGHSAPSAGTTLPARCNKMVQDLVEGEGYAYVANDLSRPQVCVDSNRRPFAIKPQQPTGAWYPAAVAKVQTLFEALRRNLRLGTKSPNMQHTRGHFPRFTFGASHGGGQKRPTRIAPDWTKHNEALIVAFLREPAVASVIRHLESCVFTWLPDVAAFYKKLEANIDIPDALRTSRLFNLPFAAHTFNLGPYVQCWFHRDARNYTLGWCPVFVMGRFNHRTSGHFIMVEPRIVMELRPGDVMLMMSSVITHGTAPLLRGETRMSWTCFTAGAFFRWEAAGHKLVGDLTEEENAKYEEKSAFMFAEAWRANLTLDELQQRYEAEVGALRV